MKINMSGADLLELIAKHPELELEITKGAVGAVTGALTKKLVSQCMAIIDKNQCAISEEFSEAAAAELIERLGPWGDRMQLTAKAKREFAQLVCADIDDKIKQHIADATAADNVGKIVRENLETYTDDSYNRFAKAYIDKKVAELLPEALDNALTRRFGGK